MDPRRLPRFDLAVAAAFTVFLQLEVWLGERYDGHPAFPGPRSVTVAFLLVAGLAMAWRRARATASFAVTLGAVIAMVLIQTGGEFAGGFFVLLFSVYTAATWSERPVVVVVLGLIFLALHGLRDPDVTTFIDWLFPGIFMAAGFALGRTVRTRLHRAERAEADAAQAVADERARMARELHDVVAHSVSVMVMQAKGGAAVLEHEPDRAREAFDTIESSGRQALDELRLMLGLLAGDPGDVATRRAQPGLGRLDELVATTRASGLEVSVTVAGAPGTLSDIADLSAYRILQESLTNVVRHAGARRALVDLEWRPGELELIVRDDGRGVARLDLPSGGRGLAGMRERVGMLGGSLVAAPSAGGGFEVRAVLPVGER